MDNTDQRLIVALRRDGRAAIAELAAQLHVSRATVRQRLARLRERGEITGFSVLTRADITDAPVRGLMMIGIEGRGGDGIMRGLTGFTAVSAVHSTNGKWDLIVEIATDTLDMLDAIIRDIRNMDGVVTSETNLLLSSRRGAGSRPTGRGGNAGTTRP